MDEDDYDENVLYIGAPKVHISFRKVILLNDLECQPTGSG